MGLLGLVVCANLDKKKPYETFKHAIPESSGTLAAWNDLKTRSNTLELECGPWGTEEEKICKMCYEETESLTHFLVGCDSLQD